MTTSLLYDYQRLGMQRLMRGNCLLADEMGLGKTVEVASAISKIGTDKKSIVIIAPLSAISVWIDIMAIWCSIPIKQWRKGDPISQCIVCNPESISHLIMELNNKPIDILIADEAHMYKNRKTLRSKLLLRLSRSASIVWLLTGTPILNRVDELWNLLHILHPNNFKSYWAFVQRWANARPGKYGWVIDDYVRDEYLDSFASTLSPYVLRRTKEDVGMQLPPVTYETVTIPMTMDQRKLYKAISTQILVETSENKDPITIENLLTRTTRLRQAALCPSIIDPDIKAGQKYQVLSEIISGTEDKIIVFCEWSSPLITYWHSRYTACENSIMLYGQMTQREREEALAKWRHPKGPQTLLATYGTGGVALTLTESSTVIQLNETWVPAINEQAIARVVRHGQTKPVNVYRLRTKGSIEEVIAGTIGDKTALVEAVNEALRKWASQNV